MTDKDRCGQVSSLIRMSSSGNTSETFVRNLCIGLKSLGIELNGENKEPIWGRSENSQCVEALPLSPEEEIENPLSNGAISYINTDGLVHRAECHKISDNTVPNSCNGTNGHQNSFEVGSPIDDFLESYSSVDETYETASDHSADEEDVDVECVRSNSTLRNGSEENEQEYPSSFYHVENPDETVPKIRRCSSLKSGKTPPGTPGSKKIVRFADALGLDLADVKTFVDEIPKIPTSAYHDLRNLEDDDADDFLFMKPERKPEKTLVPLFQQPGGQLEFLDKIKNQYVSLENALVDDPVSFAIRGIVRVRNIDFHKSVFVRYSTDAWKSFVDVQASYVENSCDGFSDKFSFLIYANMLGPGQVIEFAVVFQARGEQFWDNNMGMNYCFQCLSTQTPSLAPLTHVLPSAWNHDHWGASFY